jgi:hypothetical protein
MAILGAIKEAIPDANSRTPADVLTYVRDAVRSSAAKTIEAAPLKLPENAAKTIEAAPLKLPENTSLSVSHCSATPVKSRLLGDEE